MKLFLSSILFFCCFHLLSQVQPFTENEKLWMDSINTLMKWKNPYFDSLMKTDGKGDYTFSNEARKRGDTVPDIFYGYRSFYKNGIVPADGTSGTGFSYYFKKKEIDVDRGEFIYLKPDGPVILDIYSGGFMIGGNYRALIRTTIDTLYDSNVNPKNTYAKHPADSSKYLIFTENYSGNTEIVQVVIGRNQKEIKTDFEYLKGGILIQSNFDSILSRKNYLYPEYRKGSNLNLLFDNDEAKHISSGDTLLLKIEHHYCFDTINHLQYDYSIVKEAYPFKAKQVKQILEFTSTFIFCANYNQATRIKISYKAYLRKSNRRKKNPLRYDPIFHYLKKKKIFTPLPKH